MKLTFTSQCQRSFTLCLLTSIPYFSLMDKNEVKTDIMLIIAAILWGLGFVAQREGMEHIGPFFYTTLRFGIGVICLIPIYFMTRKEERKIRVDKKQILIAGLIVGIFLFLGVNSQQIGLVTTTAGKASFITALYMILVPVFGLLIGHRTRRIIWVAILIALAGLYFMSINESFRIETGDLFVIACAIFWAVHFLFISHVFVKGRSHSIINLTISGLCYSFLDRCID